jgi:orotidine-5'-phosphate decarboxylase
MATTVPTPTNADVRDRLALVLDVEALDEATALARRLAPWFGVAKVGLELFTAVGPDAVKAMQDLGFRVFLDLKLHDIPNTVAGAARSAARLGATWLTVHAAGGAGMLRAAVEAAGEGAATGAATGILGVTVLTSEPDAGAFPVRLQAAVDAGCAGIVCSAHELAAAKRAAPGLVAAVPGLRLAGQATNDQARPATPGTAAAAGADLLVIGRAVTAAGDVAAAAEAVTEDVRRALCATPAAHGGDEP